jgi:hypothetical protein
MRELIRLYTQIALLRQGPQDVPASPFLLAITAVAYFAIQFVVGVIFPPFEGPWIGHLCVDVVFVFIWYAVLLRLVKRPERFLQTTTAVYGFQAVLAPLLVSSVWLTQRLPQESVWKFPVTALGMAMLIWVIAANSHIVKAALEWSMPPSVALVILQTLAGNVLQLALFPMPTTP